MPSDLPRVGSEAAYVIASCMRPQCSQAGRPRKVHPAQRCKERHGFIIFTTYVMVVVLDGGVGVEGAEDYQ